MKKILVTLILFFSAFNTFLYAADASSANDQQQEETTGFWSRFMRGWARPAGTSASSSDYLGIGSAGRSLSSSLAFSSFFFSQAIIEAARDIKLNAHVEFQPSDLAQVRIISQNLKLAADNLTKLSVRADERTLRTADDIASRLANPEIKISPKTTIQLGIIGLAATGFYFASSTLRSLAEKYINRSAQPNPTTDGAITAASCAILAGSAYTILNSGKLAGCTPQVTPKRMRQKRQCAQIRELQDS